MLNDSKGVNGIVEEAFIILWNSKIRWKSAAALRRDLFGITHSICTARLNNEKKGNRDMGKRSFFYEYIRAQVFSNIRDTLDNIPEEYHGIFILRFVWRKELSVVENTLGIPKEKVIEIQSKIQCILHNKYSN
jgi:hypothetical protein